MDSVCPALPPPLPPPPPPTPLVLFVYSIPPEKPVSEMYAFLNGYPLLGYNRPTNNFLLTLCATEVRNVSEL